MKVKSKKVKGKSVAETTFTDLLNSKCSGRRPVHTFAFYLFTFAFRLAFHHSSLHRISLNPIESVKTVINESTISSMPICELPASVVCTARAAKVVGSHCETALNARGIACGE